MPDPAGIEQVAQHVIDLAHGGINLARPEMILGRQPVEHEPDVAEGLTAIVDQLTQAFGRIRRVEKRFRPSGRERKLLAHVTPPAAACGPAFSSWWPFSP